MPVLSYDEMVRHFGDPSECIDGEGNPTSEWMQRMISIRLPAPIPYIGTTKLLVSLRCHKKVAPHMQAAFDTLYHAGQWALLKDCGGAFCWRLARKSTAMSHHAWGIAVDVNVADNPFLKAPKMDARIIRAFETNGFIWGGDWLRRKDGMHFEFYDTGRLSHGD